MYNSHMNSKLKLSSAILVMLMAGGCAATSLQCGTDSDSSFVNLNTTPNPALRANEMQKLCAFNSEYTQE